MTFSEVFSWPLLARAYTWKRDFCLTLTVVLSFMCAATVVRLTNIKKYIDEQIFREIMDE